MNWHNKQQHEESVENRRNDLITKELQGKRVPTLKAVILWINSKRKVKL